METSELTTRAIEFKAKLESTKDATPHDGWDWYPYGTLNNFYLIEQLLEGTGIDVPALCEGGPVLDIGAADGDTAFFFESLGIPAHVVDYPPTNFNSCRGVRALRDALDSKVSISETDLDAQFRLPEAHYGLAFFLGILYHLKNPFYALERLGRHAKHAFISTRIARFNTADPQTRVDLSGIPVGYLLAHDECNNDATNFWIFSEAGLRRLLHRAGWDVVAFRTFGAVGESDPATNDGDERAFCLVRSRHA